MAGQRPQQRCEQCRKLINTEWWVSALRSNRAALYRFGVECVTCRYGMTNAEYGRERVREGRR